MRLFDQNSNHGSSASFSLEVLGIKSNKDFLSQYQKIRSRYI
jgi:hypothetical protein